MEEAFPQPIFSPTLVGRAAQLTILHSLIDQAKSGGGGVALISGEAGIGKSRLLAEAKTHAATQGFLLLQGNCFPTDMSYPYAALLDLLRSTLASHPAATLITAIGTLARAIFPLLPELVPDSESPHQRLEPEQEKHRLFAVLATFFLNLSTQSPLLLIIEDVHWSDDTSLNFLHYLARRCISQPLLLIVTYRHDEMQLALREWLAQLNRERLARELPLVSLSSNDVNAMLSVIFDQQHTSFDMRRFLHGDLLDAIYTLTEGNPFFVEEILSSLIATGNIFYIGGYWNCKSGSEISIPRSIQDAVQQRAEHVNEAARHVLTLAAVAGRHFDFVLLQQLTGHDEQQLLLIMKELVSAQLVIEESADQFAFRHALTRQAIYTRLLVRERTLLHRTIAETMEQLPPASLDAHLEGLAYHFYQARVWEKALDYAQRAGEKALQLYSHRAAIGYFTWTLDALNHLSRSPTPDLYLVRGRAYDTLGQFEQAQRNYMQALDTAHTLDNRSAEWHSMIALGFLWAGRDYAQAERWFRQALALAQSLNEPALHAYSLNRIGNWHLNVEQSSKALLYHQEALSIFQQLHDTHGIAQTLDLLGMTSYLGGDLIQGTMYYRQASALFRELGDMQGLTSSLATLALRSPTFQTDTMTSTASLDEAQQDAENALKVAHDIGHRSGEAYALFQFGLCLGSQGRYEAALEAGRQSLSIAEEIEHRQWQTASHTILGGVYSGLLAHSQALKHFELALALSHEIGSLFWLRLTTGYLASAAIQMHDLARAEVVLYAVLSSDTSMQTLAQRMVWCVRAELALAQRKPVRALEILDQLVTSAIPTSEEQGSLRVLKLRGEALVMLERPPEAEVAFRAALELARTYGVRPMQWRICLDLGNLYQTEGRSAEAEQAFTEARTLIEELAATVTDEALHDNFLQSTSALFPSTRTLSSKKAARQAFGGLTMREREVATLIAQGKFNREIADVLVVSERTIESHVSSILSKLGFVSRTQIATWAIEHGLAKESL